MIDIARLVKALFYSAGDSTERAPEEVVRGRARFRFERVSSREYATFHRSHSGSIAVFQKSFDSRYAKAFGDAVRYAPPGEHPRWYAWPDLARLVRKLRS